MNWDEFEKSLENSNAPFPLSDLLAAMWWDAKGDWSKAHGIADGYGTPDGDWVHAYLHRKEGDNWNANYWYRRAGKPIPKQTLDEEWETICKYLLDKNN